MSNFKYLFTVNLTSLSTNEVLRYMVVIGKYSRPTTILRTQ